MNTITLQFSGSIQELTALLTAHSLSGREFDAVITVELVAIPDYVVELKKCAGFIDAIKKYRTMTGTTLKEAKDFVDANCQGFFPGRTPL